MENTIKTIIKKHFGYDVESIDPLGGGFYGRAFLANLKQEPFRGDAITKSIDL